MMDEGQQHSPSKCFQLQLRLDFDSFTVTGPSTLTTSVSRRSATDGDIIYDVSESGRRGNTFKKTSS